MPLAFALRHASAPIHYRIDASDVRAHLYRVTLTIAHASAHQVLALPVWIPGSYMVREFSKHVQKLRAYSSPSANISDGAEAQPIALQQLDKCTWQADCKAGSRLVLEYEVYAFDNSVRTAWLDSERAFFNPTALCLRVLGQESAAHALSFAPLTQPLWQIYTAATASNDAPADTPTYLFDDYDHMADTPFALGDLWLGSFEAEGIVHRFVISGLPANFDGARLLQDTQAICSQELQFWARAGQGAAQPFAQYLFILHASEDGYGGLEHANSTALICAQQDLPRLGDKPQGKGYTTLLGLISHEYFHSWNVKRLRPAELARYDYGREQYTELLWFFEGFTSYYDDLFLRRAGLLDDAGYLQLLTNNVLALSLNPGAQVQSVAQASFDAWVKYYRHDENTPNATVSYYTKGALVALCFDLRLRAEGPGSLDAVMHLLWKRSKGGPISEADIAAALQTVGGRSYAPELAQWVHGKGELPVLALLAEHGIGARRTAPSWLQRWGFKVQESGSILKVLTVLRDSAAEAANLAAGDEILAINNTRIKTLEQLHYLLSPAQQDGLARIDVLYARGGRVLHSQAQLASKPAEVLRELWVEDASKAQKWLQG